jgi:hypothetical protein
MGPHNEMVSIVAGAVQVGVLMYLSVRRWKQLYVKNPQVPMKIQGS